MEYFVLYNVDKLNKYIQCYIHQNPLKSWQDMTT